MEDRNRRLLLTWTFALLIVALLVGLTVAMFWPLPRKTAPVTEQALPSDDRVGTDHPADSNKPAGGDDRASPGATPAAPMPRAAPKSRTEPEATATKDDFPPSRIGPLDIYADPQRTPGTANPHITQANIAETICNPRWSTRSIRPPREYTTQLKVQQIREYRYTDKLLRDYEEDHLIPLELGGHPTDRKNLWPEPFDTSIPDGGAHAKDQVENYLHAEVCSGDMTLEEAQKAIREDWYRVYTEAVAP